MGSTSSRRVDGGQTELDLVTDNGLSSDIITKVSGESMQGTPVSLAVLYMQQYVNPDNNEMGVSNMLNIFTTADYRAYRTEDMQQTFDHSTICYAGEANDDVYYNISNGANYGFLMSKKGISSKRMQGANILSTGKFSLPAIDDEVTKHIQMLSCGRMGMAYWSNLKHGIRRTDNNCSYATDVTSDPTGQEQCLASGINRIRINGMGALTEKKELSASLHLPRRPSWRLWRQCLLHLRCRQRQALCLRMG